MKKILLFLFAALLFGFEIIKTDGILPFDRAKIVASINVSILDKNLTKVLKKVSKTQNGFCVIKNYNIFPFYEYVNKKQLFKGYKADVYLRCVFDKNKSGLFNKYINKTSSFSKIRINSISFMRLSSRVLKTEAYKKAESFAKEISKKLNKKCFLKSMSFYNNAPSRYKSFSLPVPNNGSKFNFSYVIECL